MSTKNTGTADADDAADAADLEAVTQYGRDLLELRRHARALAYYLGEIGVPRGETRMTLDSLVAAGINDAYDDLAVPR